MTTSRRQFIKQCALAYGSVLFLPGCKNVTLRPLYRSFSDDTAEVIGAICEQFIPTDDFAGAKEAGVVNYIDKLLYQRFPELKDKYSAGIRSVKAATQNLYEKSFIDMEWVEQTRFLQQMERSELPDENWTEISQRDFFEMILRHTMQGYYGSPRHGGNKNYVSYRMMKLDFPLLIGQNRYEK